MRKEASQDTPKGNVKKEAVTVSGPPSLREAHEASSSESLLTRATQQILTEMQRMFVDDVVAPTVYDTLPSEAEPNQTKFLDAVRAFLSDGTPDNKIKVNSFYGFPLDTFGLNLELRFDLEALSEAVSRHTHAEGEDNSSNKTTLLEPELLPWWKRLVASPTAQSVFGDFLPEEDQRIYEEALHGSLRGITTGEMDPYTVECLYFYPTPDAIRNLVIIATIPTELDPDKMQEKNRDYHKTTAQLVLRTLGKNDIQWGKVRKKTETKYPLFKDTLRAMITPEKTLLHRNQEQNLRDKASEFFVWLLTTETEKGAAMDKDLVRALQYILTVKKENGPDVAAVTSQETNIPPYIVDIQLPPFSPHSDPIKTHSENS